MYDMDFTVLHEYRQGGFQWGPEHVAHKVHKLGINRSDFLWADINDADMNHAVVIWHKNNGSSLPIRAIFDPSDHDQEDLDLYYHGKVGSSFHADLACEIVYCEREDAEDKEEWDKLFKDVHKRTREIIALGDFWCRDIEGSEIPEYNPVDDADVAQYYTSKIGQANIFQIKTIFGHYESPGTLNIFGRDLNSAIEYACEKIQEIADRRGNKVKITDFASMRDYLVELCISVNFSWEGAPYRPHD